MIKAIDTEYNGFLFRSRLEAKFGVFFDALGAEWIYENEGFWLSPKEKYLPDFYFPKQDMYAEVKPVRFTFAEHSKCKRLALLTGSIVVELVGLPSMDMMNVIIPALHYICPVYGQQYAYKDKRSHKCKCGAYHSLFKTINECEGVMVFSKTQSIAYGNTDDDYSRLDYAIRKAIQYRFEHKHKK